MPSLNNKLCIEANENKNETLELGVESKGCIRIDVLTNKVIYEKNADDKLYPASMTKMLTAMVVLDSMNPEDAIKVDYSINEIPLDSSRAGVTVGEIFTVDNVIRGLIIPSGNDIANAAASAVAKKEQSRMRQEPHWKSYILK